MNELLQELDAWLRANRPDYYANLRDPWTNTQFATLEQMAGQTLPAAFHALYEWKGGQSALAAEMLYADWRFLQFEEVRIAYQTYNELYEMGEFKHPDYWNPKWVPFLENESEVLLCLDLAGAMGGQPGQIVTFQMGETQRTIEFPSMEDMFRQVLAGYVQAKQSGALSEPIRVAYPPGYPIMKEAK